MSDPTSDNRSLGHVIVDRLTQPQFLLSVMSGIFLWWLAYRLLAGGVPEQARELVAALVGFISGQMVGPGWQFYFGTNQSSASKTSALESNAKTLEGFGIPVGSRAAAKRQTQPVPVKVTDISPYADKTDDELAQLLSERGQVVGTLTREQMIKLLTELDAEIPTEPRA